MLTRSGFVGVETFKTSTDDHLTVPHNYPRHRNHGGWRCKFLALNGSTFRSGGAKLSNLIIDWTSHIPHYVSWFTLVFHCKINRRISVVHFHKESTGEFFVKFHWATLNVSCLCSQMERTYTVWLVLSLPCFRHAFKNSIPEFHFLFLYLSQMQRLATLNGGFHLEPENQSLVQLPTSQFAVRLLDSSYQIHHTLKVCLISPL